MASVLVEASVSEVFATDLATHCMAIHTDLGFVKDLADLPTATGITITGIMITGNIGLDSVSTKKEITGKKETSRM